MTGYDAKTAPQLSEFDGGIMKAPLSAESTRSGPTGRVGTTLRRSLAAMVALTLGVLALGATATGAGAVTYDPGTCTAGVSFDPSIPTPESVVGSPLAPETGGTNATNQAALKPTATLYPYLDAIAAAAPEMVIKRSVGTTALGRDIPYVVVSSPGNVADLESDAAFWRSVREGEVNPAVAHLAINNRPAFAWISSNVHGNEPSGGEATIKMIYELAARRDCANYQRLENLTSFLLPVQNPDGRDEYQRTNAWAFDLNRDWHTQEQAENYLKMSAALEYPSVVYLDVHQQGGSSFFFPPNEDPVHHELSDASMNGINFIYGPALQKRFNDQNISYNNYNAYDLFTPEYGDTAPSLLLGAAGMTFEKGRGGSYAKQVYDHYLSLDETLNTTSREKRKILGAWIDQWPEAIAEGAAGELEPNQIVSPGHSIAWEVPDQQVFGYYFLPNNHDGDASKMLAVLQRAGVKVYRLNQDTAVTGRHTFGDMTVNDPDALGPERQTPNAVNGTLPAGTLWVPMAQSMKHWIQALLGEDPYVPYAYFYDVTGWSFSQLKGMSGNGFLQDPLPSSASATEVSNIDLGSAPAQAATYYAFSTDSSRALIMTYKMAEAGADVFRSTSSFTAGGSSFPTGSALVTGSSLSGTGLNLANLADEYQTPIAGLDTLPAVERFEIEAPKVAIYGQASGGLPVTLPPAGRCDGGTTFCQAYFTLGEKMGIPPDPLTSTEIGNGDLVSGGYTALINPGSNISAGPATTAIQAFVNQGGNYFSWGAGGTSTARTAGMTLADTTTNGPTDGVVVNGDFDTDSPLAWGFDNGGFLFRPFGSITYDPATLAGDGGAIPAATSAITYPDPTLRFSFGTDIADLNGKPAAIDQPFGAGTVSLLSIDPTFRAWLEGAERLILNGVMYPNGAAIAAPAAQPSLEADADQQLLKSELPKVKNRPVKKFHDSGRDVKIKVAKRKGKALRKAFRKTKVPGKIRRKARFRTGKHSVTLVVPGARNTNRDRILWAQRVMKRLDRMGVKPKYTQL